MNVEDGMHVVTAFLRHGGDVLLLERSDAVGTDRGRWGGVSGNAEGDPDEQVRVEIEAETGLDPDRDCSLVRSSRPLHVADSDRERPWIVHPYLFDCVGREVELSDEHDAFAWGPPTAMLEADRETVPGLWSAYEGVAPTVRSIVADDDHGAATLSIRALEVLRDRAGLLVSEREDEGDEVPADDADEEWDELASLARRLLEARPSMAVLRNRVNRTMATAEPRDAAGVLESALAGIDRALEADEAAAAAASEHAGGSVLTHSRSGTVREALERAEPDRVFVAESRPAREGVDVAEALAETTWVTLCTDAAVAHVLESEDIDALLVGADTVLPDGRVVNKTGTRAAAIAAAHDRIPVYVVAASDKVSTREAVSLESGPMTAVYDGDAALDVANPTFDVTPADCVTGVVTEAGTLEADEVGIVAEELRSLEDWDEA